MSETNTTMIPCKHSSYRSNLPFPHSTSVRTDNSTSERFGVEIFMRLLYFFHPGLDLALSFLGMRERYIECFQMPRNTSF